MIKLEVSVRWLKITSLLHNFILELHTFTFAFGKHRQSKKLAKKLYSCKCTGIPRMPKKKVIRLYCVSHLEKM